MPGKQFDGIPLSFARHVLRDEEDVTVANIGCLIEIPYFDLPPIDLLNLGNLAEVRSHGVRPQDADYEGNGLIAKGFLGPLDIGCEFVYRRPCIRPLISSRVNTTSLTILPMSCATK